MKIINKKNIGAIVLIIITISNILVIIPSDNVSADPYNGEDLALAILSNSSWLVDCSYSDTDQYANRQSAVLSSLGTLHPKDGPTFAFFSTGIAGADIITTDEETPGDERGTWFIGGKKGHPRDEVTLTMNLRVPMYMHYIYYDVQFLSAEYPEYVGTVFNDKLTITVYSPTLDIESEYFFDINSGFFVLDSRGISNTGFDIFALSGNPSNVDTVNQNQRVPGADAGASGLITIGGKYHPVSPNEIITLTINLKDSGDNLFDSGAFIDNLIFTGFAKTDISAIKIAYKNNELIEDEPIECGDKIKYEITISNTGTADQKDNTGNEFEDVLPEEVTLYNLYEPDYGIAYYNEDQHKIIWNVDIPAITSRFLKFEVIVNEDLDNGTIISNQGVVNWDSNEDRINDEIEFTDNPYYNDGIDLDNDGETGDDDPTNITVIKFEPPTSVTEDFSDDTTGESAVQSYLSRKWFETSPGEVGSIFEVASSYKYSTEKSFKTKLRKSGSSQYWNYSLSELESDIRYWEVWFKCGDTCEEYDLYLDFKNSLGQDIAKIKFEYIYNGSNPPTDWFLYLYYLDPDSGWTQLKSDFDGEYLRNSWYKLKLEKNGEDEINYYLNRSGLGQIYYKKARKLSAPFSDLAMVEWSSTNDPDPIVCPMFFWDDHKIGLI